jgi:phosphoglycolate phosphatase-like HAD superfamily hydrolase
MISNYKYIFLDVDGVVLSSINYYMNLFRDIAESLGASKNIPDEFYKKNIGVKFNTWMINIVSEANQNNIKDLFFSKNRDAAINHHQFPIIEGTKEALLKIKENNQKSCFISSKTRESMNSVIKFYNLESVLDFSISGDEVKNFKPDPEGIIKALEYFKAKPDEAIFVGDSLHDLGAARNADVRFIGVLTGICTKSDWELEKVSYVPSVKEIYTL